jgi:hypothetical protein
MAGIIGDANDPVVNTAGVVRRAARKEWLYLIVALIGGMIGGALANRFALATRAFASDTPVKSIAAQEILLVDVKGKTRASLHLNADGFPVLNMFDNTDKNRLGMGFAKGGIVGMDLADPKGTQRVLLSVGGESVPALRFFDDLGRLRLLAGIDGQGDPSLEFYDHDGKLMRELP